MAMVRTGIEVLRQQDFALLKGKRVALMTNHSAVDSQLVSTYRVFAESPNINLTALFGPEHGFLGAAQDTENVASGIDPLTGVPVYSLYGETYRPTSDMLADLDAIVCDIQDIGVRYYTFLWTVSHILEAAGVHGIEVVILDRPNPLGGDVVSGSPLDDEFTSFVGRYSVPVGHGMTLGEMVQLINAAWNPFPVELTVVPCEGWHRSMRWDETGLCWIAPSPNMPTIATVKQYPGACLIEGTQLSEGRGTTLPFEIVGAPWIDARVLANCLNAQGWAGVRFRPHVFKPSLSKWSGQQCEGVQVHITDESAFQPIYVWLKIIEAMKQCYPDEFAWLPPHPTGVDRGEVYHFDRLIGSSEVRQHIDAGRPLDDLFEQWQLFCDSFMKTRRPYLLYD